MLKPSVDEMRAALDSARGTPVSGSGSEPAAAEMARCLVYLHERNVQLEKVYEAVEAWLHSGLAEQEHAGLLRALGQARDVEQRCTHQDPDDVLGL